MHAHNRQFTAEIIAYSIEDVFFESDGDVDDVFATIESSKNNSRSPDSNFGKLVKSILVSHCDETIKKHLNRFWLAYYKKKMTYGKRQQQV